MNNRIVLCLVESCSTDMQARNDDEQQDGVLIIDMIPGK